MQNSTQVDVGIMIYGKPYQTAVSLHTLYKYSKQHINKIYVTFEKVQPFGFDMDELKGLLEGLPVVYNVSERFFGFQNLSSNSFKQKLKFLIPSYRKSVRYQYAWEEAKMPYLFLMHNDMLFSGDLIGKYLDVIGTDIAAGSIGQCWNCPAFNKSCVDQQYYDYRPTSQELADLYKDWPHDRASSMGLLGEGKVSWPLPECRLNEFVALFNIPAARKLVFPRGKARLFGLKNSIDFGIPWFQDISHMGIKLRHTSYDTHAEHGWCSNHAGGTQSLTNESLYVREEEIAKTYYEENCK
jgi:hypothetical protein